MKKITAIALVALLVLSLAACGKSNDNAANTTPTTETSMLPQMDPTMDTNVPDESVNNHSTDSTDQSTAPGNDTTANSNSKMK